MAQKRNLNVNPYYDDFDSDKNFNKVLFKPGFPVQSRELTTLQSILQNQIESFGKHIFKEGSMVIPGGITYDPSFYAVKLNAINSGVEVSAYINNFIGTKITGQVSGVTATIKYVAFPGDPNIDDLTIYVKYDDSSSDFEFTPFLHGEFLIANKNITYGNTTINSGTPFASLLSSNATSTGSSVSIQSGVYFIRGYFVNVNSETMLLDEYSNTPSYRVGLRIDELLVGAKDDSSLYDNAKGFSNYAAPGADRLKIGVSLSKKSLNDLDDKDFIELLRIDNGKIKKNQDRTQYNIIREYLAQRTYEESGNYAVVPFIPTLKNSLNDRLGNDGLYDANQTTEQLNTPSDDLLCVQVSPGKAYVKGFDVKTDGTLVLDVDKPRDTAKNVTNVPFSMGNVLRVNNVTGHPTQNGTIDFYSRHGGEGVNIGKSRVYTFTVTDQAYSGPSTKWNLYLYDVQTYTRLNLNNSVSASALPATSFVKGKNSGANGYAVSAGSDSNNNLVTLTQVSGKFAIGEQILINGVEVSNSITDVISYGTQDIKSVSQSSSGFVADSSLESFPLPNDVSEITINSNTVTSAGGNFTGITTDTVIRYKSAVAGDTLETFFRVADVSKDGLQLTTADITGVSGVFKGGITDGTYQARIGAPIIRNQEDAKLYEKFPNNNISSLDLSSSNLKIRLQSNQTQTSDLVGIVTMSLNDFDTSGISTVNFSAFDAERYSLYNDSAPRYIGTITSDSFKIDTANNTVSFSGLSPGRSYKLDATLTKVGIKSKKKNYTRSTELIVNLSRLNQSGTNSNTTVNDGLTYNNNCYGLRVQDEEISLNVPDVSEIIAVYESLNSSDPVLDKITCLSSSNIAENAIVGENIISKSGIVIARFVKSTLTDVASIVYLNSGRFNIGDVVIFKESNITTTITNIQLGSYTDITDNFILDRGQRDQYYDYSRIVRRNESTIPSKRLLIIFDHYEVEATDNGDLFTIQSYDNDRYEKNIPLIGVDAVRATDTFDYRPRVSAFTGNSASPFDFTSRNFTSLSKTIAPNEDSLVSYDYYIGRIDKLYIDKLGVLGIKQGQSGIRPKAPLISDDAMEIATISLPPYLFDPQDAEISLVDNRRYTMRDIGLIEDRVENLEEVTSLSLLEINTQTLQIKDAENRDRFKSGFFVDDFRNNSLINKDISSIQIDEDNHEMRPTLVRSSLKGSIAISGNNRNPESIDYEDPSLTLIDPNVKKKGNSITLDYDEVTWISQFVATKYVNVNEYQVSSYRGDVTLSPPNDFWTITQNFVSFFNNVNFGAAGGFSQSFNSFSQSSAIRFARSRNTQFSASNLKPHTRYYQFLDSEGNLDVIPKLLQVEDVKGSFTIGEEVVGYEVSGDSNSVARIRFRLAKPNHKTGPIISPESVYQYDPYSYPQAVTIPDSYTEGSTILNVDTASLSQSAQGRYSGYLEKGFILEGQSSGATAFVKDLRLITDAWGDLVGSFFIRNPNIAGNIRVENSTHTYKLTNSSTNRRPLISEDLDTLLSFARTQYITRGTLVQTFTSITNTTTIAIRRYVDPLAQSFAVGSTIDVETAIGRNNDDNGIFLTGANVYFATVDEENKPLRVEIRTVELGTPTREVIGQAAYLTPRRYIDDGNGNISEETIIKTSETGDVATRVTFPEPIYLAPGREYALVIISEYSDQYQVWVAEKGKKSVTVQNLPNPDAGVYSSQYAFGGLFMSQNGSIWTEDQNMDLKFDLFKAKFKSSSGTAYFYNAPLDLSNGYKRELPNNSLKTLPKTATIRITPVKKGASDFSDMETVLSPGRKLAGDNNYPGSVAYITGVGCSVFNNGNDVGIITGGTNYGINASTNVGTFNIVGNGKNLTLDVPATTNGTLQIAGLVVNNGGSGYKVGDVVGIVTADTIDRTGKGAQISINEIGGIDTLFVSGMQGDTGSNKAFNVGMGVSYYDDNGVVVSMANTTITGIDNGPTLNSGNYFKVNHFNHGMFGATNKVVLNDITPSAGSATTLTADLASSDVSEISIGSTVGFDIFEGVIVSPNNPGYVKIGREIIQYNDIDIGNKLIDITRGIDNTNIIDHNISDINGNQFSIPVSKYELNGISLRRINGVTLDVSSEGMDISGYYVSVDRSSNGTSRASDDNATSYYSQLSFTNEYQTGGKNANASENIAFTEIIPSFPLILPNDSTSVSGSIRTISGTSVDGSENSFVDNGYEPVELNQVNKLSSVRIVASEVNEETYLSTLPSNKSLTTAIRLSTTDENLSPQIFYLEETGTILQMPLINNPITDYASDNKVNSFKYDPHAAVYVSNTVNLKNPAKALKVLVAAYRHQTADFRVLYKLNRADSSEVEQEFELFPGYDNLRFENDALLTVIDQSKNNGKPDVFVRPSLEDEFLDYEFTANNLDLFTGYTIKIVMSGTNAAYYPRFKDLRTIAIRWLE